MDIGDGAGLELVDMFCYLSDMLSVDGNAEPAVEAGVHGLNKFRLSCASAYHCCGSQNPNWRQTKENLE